MGSVLIRNATVLTVDTENRVFEGGWITFEDSRITGVGSRETTPDPSNFDETSTLDGHLVLPGLVNAHTHSAMVLFRGHSEGQSLLTMQGWYNAIREPELSLVAADIGPAVALSCAEMVLSGTTTFCDQYFFAEEIAEAAEASGLRAVIAYGIVELDDAAHGRQELARAADFVARRRGNGSRIIPWLGPHAPYIDNAEDLIRAEVATALEHDCGLHLHMAVGPEDNQQTLERYGLTAAQALQRDGFFKGRVHAAHCLDLSKEDIAVFASADRASIAYCASAGLRSGRQGICPAVALRKAGVTVALGTDNVAANNSYDMILEMRIAGHAASHREGRAQPLSSRDLLRMATIDGARALGLDDAIGSLETDKSADIIAIDLSGPGYSETPDPETLLIYSGSGRDVTQVWVAGEHLVRDGALTRRDFSEIRGSYARTYRDFWARVEAARRVA